MPRPSNGRFRTGTALWIACLVVLVAGLGWGLGPGQDGAVAEFRGGPEHSGVYHVRGAPQYGGLAWQVQTGGPVRSTPVLAGGTVYVGSADGKLYAIDAATGDIRWHYDAGAPVNSSPAVDGETVYFTSQDGACFAVERATGHLRWRTPGKPLAPLAWGNENGDYWSSSPTIAGDLLLVGSGDGNLYAQNLKDGAVRWQLATGGRVRSSPAVERGTVYVGSFDGTVYAADLATGKLRWRYDTEGHGLDSKDFGFDRKSIQSSPAVVDGTVYIGARDGYLYALDASAGKLRWRIPYSMSWIISSPAVTGGLVYVGTSDGHYFQAVQAADGKERWRFRTRSSVWTSAALAGDVVYLGESAGLVYALDRNTGALRWKFRTGGPVFSSPVPGEGVVVFGSVDGAVYAVRDGGNPLARAVFFDSAFADRSGASARKFVADYLAGRDYAPVDAAGLAGFLADRIRDRRPSVVVFAVDELPAAAAAGSPALLRRYLNAGGKVVWVGVPPLIWPPDSTGGRDYAHIDREATRRLLDVDHTRANFDLFGARITDVGRRWGLRGWQLSRWGVGDSSVTALAVDENGLAAIWYRSYGGPPGSGFVRLPNVQDSPEDLAILQRMAEHFPLR